MPGKIIFRFRWERGEGSREGVATLLRGGGRKMTLGGVLPLSSFFFLSFPPPFSGFALLPSLHCEKSLRCDFFSSFHNFLFE